MKFAKYIFSNVSTTKKNKTTGNQKCDALQPDLFLHMFRIFSFYYVTQVLILKRIAESTELGVKGTRCFFGLNRVKPPGSQSVSLNSLYFTVEINSPFVAFTQLSAIIVERRG